QVRVAVVVNLHLNVLPNFPAIGLFSFARPAALMIVVIELDRARHRDFTRTHHFLDSERTHDRDERFDLFRVTGQLDSDCARADIDHVRAKRRDDRVELGARALVDRDLYDHHLAIDRLDVLEVGDFDHRDELVELLVDLLDDLIVAGGDQHDPRDRRIERILVHGQGLDVKAAARKQSGHACEHAEFVFNQNRYRMTCHAVACARSWPEPVASASLLLIAAENRHHAIFRGELKLLDPFFFDFLFVGQVMLTSKDFEFLFERLMLCVEGPQLLVMGQMLPNEFFLSMLHTPSVPMPAGFFEVGLNVASGVLIYSGSSEAARSVSPRVNRAPPSAATQTPRKSSMSVSKTATLWPRDSTRAAASFALWSPANITSSVMRDARCSSAITSSSDNF